MWQLSDFDAEDFLSNYWQKKPLLIRQALPGFKTMLSPEELAGLACEEGVHSRLIIEKDAESPWHLQYGPFTDEDFSALPETHYSLLVSECEKWIPELQTLVELFNFIPRWRIDDLMISYAPDQGSVGPHIDEYDVFLIQASGKRSWSIEQNTADNPDLIPGLDLAIMQDFNADQEWILEPGDMLYLPPKIPHHGVAVGNGCMTYSVGFRAPAVSDIMDSFLLEASDSGLTDTRYFDVPLTTERDPAEITVEDILHFKSMVYKLLDQSSKLWPDVVGKLVSDSTLSQELETIDCDNIQQAIAYQWYKHPDSKIFYHHLNNMLRLYANGQVHALEFSADNLTFCRNLCNQDNLDLSSLIDQIPQATIEVVMNLIQNRVFLPVLDDELDE